MSISPHLVRRGNTFHFRIAVPRELVAQLGKVEIKTTLKTTDPLTAKQRIDDFKPLFANRQFNPMP